jgi:hypothetical protein
MATAAPPRGANPFDDSGVRAGTGGVRRYPGLHASLLDMLRDSGGRRADRVYPSAMRAARACR